MKKKYLLIPLLFIALFLSACNISDANIKERVNAPKNNKPPIEGKWEIKEKINLEEDKNNLEKDIYIGQLGLFHKDAVIIGEDYATEPSFKLKNVNTYDYLLYKYKISPRNLNINEDEIQIITIFKDNQYFYEFIRVQEDKILVNLDDNFYIMEKIVDDVSIEEINRYINVEKSMIRTFETIESEKLETGLLLGIKIPTYDEEHEVSNWEYKTIWINSQDRNIISVYELDNLLVPRKNGFWLVHVDREMTKKDIKDEIKAIPQFVLEKENTNEEEEFSIMSSIGEKTSKFSFPSILKHILFVGNDYISVEKIEVDKNNKKSLEVYAMDNLEDEKPIKLSDIIGKDGKEIFNEGQKIFYP